MSFPFPLMVYNSVLVVALTFLVGALLVHRKSQWMVLKENAGALYYYKSKPQVRASTMPISKLKAMGVGPDDDKVRERERDKTKL